MIYLMACLLLIGAIFGVIFRVKIIVAIMGLWLLIILPLSAFTSMNNILLWILAAAIVQCGYFLGLVIRAMLEANGYTISGLTEAFRGSRSGPRSTPKKDPS